MKKVKVRQPDKLEGLKGSPEVQNVDPTKPQKHKIKVTLLNWTETFHTGFKLQQHQAQPDLENIPDESSIVSRHYNLYSSS